MRHLFHSLLALCCSHAALAASLDLQFLAVDGRGLGGTVVTLRSMDSGRPRARPAEAVVDQMDRQFVPAVAVVPVGSQIVFPNSDSVSHQVYSFSPAKRFQLPLYRGKPYPPVLFDREGVVTLGCNIHDQMRAYVYVVDAQYYGRTDAAGRWSAANVEPGEYQLEIWHPLSRVQRPVLEQRVSVPADGAQLTLRAAAALPLRAVSEVPANWDVY
jgi:plastocyanin